MERRNSPVSSSGLEWQDLGVGAVYSGKTAVEAIPDEEIGGFHMPCSCSSSSAGGCNVSGFCGDSVARHPMASAMDGLGKLGSYRGMLYDDVMGWQQNNVSGTLSPSEPLTGLRLGRHREYGNHCFPQTPRSSSSSSSCTAARPPPSSAVVVMSPSSLPVSAAAIANALPTPKRSRASYQNMQNPCCQVEGCNLDLKLAKDYHRRHRICESHSKSPKVIVAGMERRFCQQCSRFHELSEFDDTKRSCRRRLSDHNARRRRVQPESINLSSSGIQSSSPALYGVSNSYQRPQNILLNGLPISLSNSAYTSMLRQQARDSPPPSSSKPPRGIEEGPPPCFSTATNEVHNSIANLHIDSERSINPHDLDQCLHVAASSNNSRMAAVPDLLSAQSLLSSNSWSLNEGESTSMEATMIHNSGNYNPVVSQQQHNLSLFESNAINPSAAAEVEGGGHGPVSLLHSINLHDADNSHLQEFHLFYDPGRFYSTHRNL